MGDLARARELVTVMRSMKPEYYRYQERPTTNKAAVVVERTEGQGS